MVSSKKKFLKILRGLIITIIIYVIISFVATKFIYDSIFQRNDTNYTQSAVTYTWEQAPLKKEFSYSCDDHFLTGRLYSLDNTAKDLIVFAPGFNSQINDYEGVVYAFLQEGFDVFIFDATGHGKSDGDSSIGFPQIINDLDATIDFVNSNNNFKYENTFLFGHSRGAYAVCCGINDYDSVSAVAAVNGPDTSMDAIMSYSVQYVGKLAYGNYPFLKLYQIMLFGTDVSEKAASEEINEADVPVLIVQAKADNVMPENEFSVYSHRNQVSSENVQFLLYDKEGHNDHVSILYNEKGQVNYDIIKKISDFYKAKVSYKEM